MAASFIFNFYSNFLSGGCYLPTLDCKRIMFGQDLVKDSKVINATHPPAKTNLYIDKN